MTITNNDGKFTHAFENNGEFTFEFVDGVGNEGTATASVNWIDKEAPTATFEYSTEELTEGPVIATLIPSEEVTIVGNGSTTYTFHENAEYTFEFVDKAGNKGYATAQVDWIKDKEPETPDDKPNDKPTGDDSNNDDNSNDDNDNNGDNNSGDNNDDDNSGNANSGDDNNNENGNSGNNNKPEEKPLVPEKPYKELVNGDVIVRVPNAAISKYKDVILDYKKLTLSDAHKYRYGEESEIYEVSLETKDKKKVNLANTVVTQIVKLDVEKEFEAVYVVREDYSVVKLNSKVNNGELEFEDYGLGKYIIAYKSSKEDNSNIENDDNNNSKPEEKTISIIRYVLSGVVVLLVMGIIFTVRLKKRD